MQREEKDVIVAKDASQYTFGIVVSTYYDDITGRLLEGAKEMLREWQVKDENISIVRVTGSFEIPYGCLSLLKENKPDAIITLGVIVKGETDHDQFIANAVAQGIMRLMTKYETPITFGVVTTNTLEQADARSQGANNKGYESAHAALESAMLKK